MTWRAASTRPCLGRALHVSHHPLVQKVRQQRQAAELRARRITLLAAAVTGCGPR
jgi:hypothetical protein